MAFFPKKRTKDVLLWMLSTKMLPPVGVLVPMYLIFRDLGLLGPRTDRRPRECGVLFQFEQERGRWQDPRWAALAALRGQLPPGSDKN